MIKLQIIVFVFNDQEQFLYFQTFQKKKKKEMTNKKIKISMQIMI